MSDSLNYRGFWNPGTIYDNGDVVEYYGVDDNDSSKIDYSKAVPYKCTTTFLSLDSPSFRCPLSGYTLPPNPTSGGGDSANQSYVHLSTNDLFAAFSSGGWSDHRSYSSVGWTGPHGDAYSLQSTNWVAAANQVNENWKNLSNYKTGGQSFSSDGLTTYSSDKYGGEAVSKEVSFDEVRGETDSDSYYISSVQNYKGDYSTSEPYKRFDIVREPKSHLFYYARRAINAVESADIVIKDFSVGPPSYVSEGSHVGTVEYSDNKVFTYSKISDGTTLTPAQWEALDADDPGDVSDWQGLYVGDQFNQRFSIGDIVDLSGLDNPLNKNSYTVLGVSEMDMFLGTFAAVSEDDVMAYEAHGGSGKTFKKQSSEVSSTAEIGQSTPETNEIWSHDKFFFDADYGSSVSFTARNKQYEYGDGYKSVAPLGINSVRMEFNLNFSNRSNREANAILHFLENRLGQHESREESYLLAYDQGISGFKMDDEALFFPYNNAENLIKRFYSFGFDHTIENEDVHTVKANIVNTTSSSLNIAEGIFVNPAPVWESTENYTEHSVVFCQDNQKYYYSQSKDPHAGFRPCLPLSGGWRSKTDHNNIVTNYEYGLLTAGEQGGYEPFSSEKVVSINEDIWTREFYWKPSIQVSLQHDPAITELSSKASPYSQYYPAHKQNINPLKFKFKFENRSDEEAYAILHFLESRLGYKSFLFVPPAPYNRKRRFYCESWSHTYVFRNNHTIEASFEQFPLGLNTPLSEDQIDNIAPEVALNRGTLSVPLDLTFKGWQVPGEDKTQHLKKVISLRNSGETDIRIKSVSNPADSKFTRSTHWGKYKSQVDLAVDYFNSNSDGSYTVTSSSSDPAEGNVPVIYQKANDQHFYSHTTNGEVSKLHSTSLALLEDTVFPVNKPHVAGLLEQPTGGVIAPGEVFFLEVYFNTFDTVDDSTPGASFTDSISIEYYYDASSEKMFDLKESYDIGNIVQYEGKVYKRTVAASSELPTNSSYWSEVHEEKEVALNVIINPELYDEKKKEITFSIDRDDHLESFAKNYDIQDNVDNIASFSQNQEDLYRDLLLNASSEGATLACPFTVEDFEDIIGLNSDLEGYLFLGIVKSAVDHLSLPAWDASTTYLDESRVSHSAKAWQKVGDDGTDAPTDESSKWQDVSMSYENFYAPEPISILEDSDAFEIDAAESGAAEHLALYSSKSGGGKFKLKLLDKNSAEAVGHVREVLLPSQGGSVNIAEAIQSSGELSGVELEEVRKVSIHLTGLFLGGSAHSPAVELGGGWGESCEIDIYIGSSSKPCYIIGKGGDGGVGMMSEGIIYEGSNASYDNPQMSLPVSGGKGGDGFNFSTLPAGVTATLIFVNGSIFAGGGGGGGGGYSGLTKRSKTSSLINIGGGGGGGAGGGNGAFPLGEEGPVFSDFGGNSGSFINNSSVPQSFLGSGGAGGSFGSRGSPGVANDSDTHKIIGGGGAGGLAITWGSAEKPEVKFNGVLASFVDKSGDNYFPSDATIEDFIPQEYELKTDSNEKIPLSSWLQLSYDDRALYKVVDKIYAQGSLVYSGGRVWKRTDVNTIQSYLDSDGVTINSNAPFGNSAKWEDVTAGTFTITGDYSPEIIGKCGQKTN